MNFLGAIVDGPFLYLNIVSFFKFFTLNFEPYTNSKRALFVSFCFENENLKHRLLFPFQNRTTSLKLIGSFSVMTKRRFFYRFLKH